MCPMEEQMRNADLHGSTRHSEFGYCIISAQMNTPRGRTLFT